MSHHQQCNTPVYYKGSIYYLAGEGNGAVRLDLSPDGSEIKEKWRNSDIKNTYNGFIIHNDKIYTTEKSQKLMSLDFNTGEIKESLRLTKGGLIFADGMLYCYSENGNINLINIEKPGMEISGKFICNYGTKSILPSVIANGICISGMANL
jgi:outer membrane protein assembly factor BamB